MTMDHVNAFALLLAMGLAAAGTLLRPANVHHFENTIVTLGPLSEPVDVVTDARGVSVATEPYQRIVSIHSVADHLLKELVEPDRLVGVSMTTKAQHPDGWRFKQMTGIERARSLETMLALEPDLVIVSNFVDESVMSRLREQGVIVFDLGAMRGVHSTIEDIRILGALLRMPKRARQLEDRYRRELVALDQAVPDDAMQPGIYVSVYGDVFFGGTTGSSYADLLHFGGVIDLAARHGYREWPQYSPEQLLTLNPSLIVTQQGMGRAICGHTLLNQLAACKDSGRVVELPGKYHTDPGLGLVSAAQAIQRLVHPELASTPLSSVLP